MTVANDVVTWAKQLTHYITGGQSRAEKMLRRKTVKIHHKVAADAMAADVTAELFAWQVPAHCADGIEIVQAVVLPSAACTGHADNHATILLDKNDGAGGARTNFASISTDTDAEGSWVAFDSKDFTLSATVANRQLVAGGGITFEITKAGDGVVVPISGFEIVYDEL